MDPNWFYSTLAQSTAAIVGLVGAFLLQRLLVQTNDVAVKREAIRAEFMELHRKLAYELRDLGRVVGSLEGLQTDLRRAIEAGEDRAEYRGTL